MFASTILFRAVGGELVVGYVKSRKEANTRGSRQWRSALRFSTVVLGATG